MLELDKRITDKTKIFNRLNADDAKEYIGQGGYFTDSLASFTDFRTVFYGVLKEAGDFGFKEELRITGCSSSFCRENLLYLITAGNQNLSATTSQTSTSV